MKINKRQLQQLIKEEIENVLTKQSNLKLCHYGLKMANSAKLAYEFDPSKGEKRVLEQVKWLINKVNAEKKWLAAGKCYYDTLNIWVETLGDSRHKKNIQNYLLNLKLVLKRESK